ncbi:minor head protein [Gordonia phage Powerball]|uniref:Uncharacterized protein n=1 Tax=Gordonia phage Powerball TaxID=2599847 RepID=A0A5J6TRP6_9CAUD|nr:minor head protein [Gordonia phage Powerball]QFG13446.1 hypothetical protein PBI_POWERBALL_10 [Gordonia phage Powerball]
MALEDNTDQVLEEIAGAWTAAMQAGADELLEASNRLVPVDDGELRASGVARAEGKESAVAYTAPHAMKQHERLDFNHPSGGQAKFLETAALASASSIEQAIADAMRNRL